MAQAAGAPHRRQDEWGSMRKLQTINRPADDSLASLLTDDRPISTLAINMVDHLVTEVIVGCKYSMEICVFH